MREQSWKKLAGGLGKGKLPKKIPLNPEDSKH